MLGSCLGLVAEESELGKGLFDSFNLRGGLLGLVIKLCPHLLLLFNIRVHLVGLGLSDIIRLEGETLFLELVRPEGDHFSESARCVGSSEECGFGHTFGLNQHCETTVNLGEKEVRFKRDIKLAISLR